MTAYKIGQNDQNIREGRLFFELDNLTILLATPTLGTQFFSNFTFKKMQEKGIVTPVELEQEKWAHPHLYKPVRAKMTSQEI